MDAECDVRVYWRHEDGGFELVTTVSIGYLGGSLPNVGDVLALWERTYWLEVTSRHFVAHSQTDRGWALIGIPVGRDRKTKLIFDQWVQDTRDFAAYDDEATEEVVQSASDLDRTNRDPAYWTDERKEILRLEREARVAAIKAAERETRNRE